MSGPIQKVLGPARSRIRILITKEPEKFVSIPNQPLEQEVQAIADTQIKIKFNIEKLQSSVDLLVSKDRDWCTLIRNPSLPEADRDKEDKLYSEAVSDKEGHFSLILMGQDKLSEWKAVVLELDHTG